WIAYAPIRELERERREIGFHDFGRRVCRKHRVLGFAPKPITHARFQSACAARALLGGGARDARGLEPAHAASGVEACTPSQARCKYDLYPLGLEARARDVRCEHEFASSRCARSQRFVLKLRPELAEKRKPAHVRRQAPFFHEGLRASDLALSGKEHEDIAGFLLQGAQGERRRTLLDARRETRA